MKKLLFIPLMLLAVVGFTQVKPKKKTIYNPKKVKELPDSFVIEQPYQDKDHIDGKMKGPGGEVVYIGPNGGRYYLKGAKKVYLTSTTSKKRQTT